MNEICPSVDTTNAAHCWHTTGKMLLCNPPIPEEICCFCGLVRANRVAVYVDDRRHGPHAKELERYDRLP